MSQLSDLARPFPDDFIQAPPKGKYGEFVSHSEVTQWLLLHAGPFSFEVTTLFREVMPIKGKDREVVTGCLGRLTIEIDGRTVIIVEPGDCENPGNWPTDGARAKDAASDAIKRCAMRVGAGLHLWAQSRYFLRRKLLETQQEAPDA